jgi:basic membrane lipoprotein Med (substrate-binding protein (PBP1-ABC) superfamily)
VNKFIFLAAAFIAWGLQLFYPTVSLAVEQKSQPLKIGFLYVGPIADNGWNYAQELGRQYVEKSLGNKVETIFAENIGENAEAERVMEKMIAQGAKLIFATSFGYLEPVERVAKRHPDIIFMQLSRTTDIKNIGNYFYWQYEPFYLSGIVAGRMTKSNKIGFVASHPIPPIVQSINAFALGAQSVNPKAKVKVVWTNTWVDPPIEVEAAKGLIDTGIDVLAFDQSDSQSIVKTAEDNNVYIIGCYSDVHQFAPKRWLTGACCNWGLFYAKVAQAVINHNWKPGVTHCSLKNDYVKLASFGPAVSPTIKKEIAVAKNKIANETVSIFHGPLKDREGKMRLAKDQKPDLKWLAEMNWFVPGVEGSLSKGNK